MPFPQSSSDVRLKAKSYLSFCYRNGVIGPYRRLHSVWILSRQDGELMLDDHEVVYYLDCAIESDPDFVQDYCAANCEPSREHEHSIA
jgi:hypothetical protein